MACLRDQVFQSVWLKKGSRCLVPHVAQSAAVRTSEGSDSLFTYCLKSSFVLHQLLLTENAVLGQKVDCREKEMEKKDKLLESWGDTGPFLIWSTTFPSVKDSHLFCASFPPKLKISSQRTNISVWVQRRFRAIFLCHGRGGVMEGRQYGQRVHRESSQPWLDSMGGRGRGQRPRTSAIRRLFLF